MYKCHDHCFKSIIYAYKDRSKQTSSQRSQYHTYLISPVDVSYFQDDYAFSHITINKFNKKGIMEITVIINFGN